MSKSSMPLFYEHDENLANYLTIKKLKGGIVALPALAYQYLEATPPLGSTSPRIEVVPEDCLALAQSLTKTHPEVCVLNLANQFLVGGDYLLGRGQEESLIRRTDLLESLVQLEGVRSGDLCNHYKYQLQDCLSFDNSSPQGFGEFTALYSKAIAVRRLGSEERPVLKPFDINVISSAAYNLAVLDETLDPELYLAGTVFKILNQLRVAKAHQQRNLVLGAFGCGAFHNSPELIAEIYNAAIAEYEFQGCFDSIRFAITKPRLTNAYSSFDIFKEKMNLKPKTLIEILKDGMAGQENSASPNPQLSKMLEPFKTIESSAKLAHLALQTIAYELNTLSKPSLITHPKKLFLEHLARLIGASPEAEIEDVLLRELKSSACTALSPGSGIFQGVPCSFVTKLTKLLECRTAYSLLQKSLPGSEGDKDLDTKLSF